MLSDEEKNIIDKLESIKVNVEGKLYNYEAARILYLINKLQKENKEKDKYIKDREDITKEMSNDVNKLLLELQQKDKQIDLMLEHITLFKSAKENPKVLDGYSGAKIVSLSKEEIKQYFEKLAKEKGE